MKIDNSAKSSHTNLPPRWRKPPFTVWLGIGILLAFFLHGLWISDLTPERIYKGFGHLLSLEYNSDYAEVARQNIIRAGLESKVEIRVGKAIELLPKIESESITSFDLIFIDADKPSYTEYFQWAVKLTRPGSLIIADNVIREGKVLDRSSKDEKVLGVQRFNQMLATNSDVTAGF